MNDDRWDSRLTSGLRPMKFQREEDLEVDGQTKLKGQRVNYGEKKPQRLLVISGGGLYLQVEGSG